MTSSSGIDLVDDEGLAKNRDVEFTLMMDLIDLDLKVDLVESDLGEKSGSLVFAGALFHENEFGLVSIRMMELRVHLYTTNWLTRPHPVKLVHPKVDVCLATLRYGSRTQSHLDPVGSDDPMLSIYFDLTARDSSHQASLVPERSTFD